MHTKPLLISAGLSMAALLIMFGLLTTRQHGSVAPPSEWSSAPGIFPIEPQKLNSASHGQVEQVMSDLPLRFMANAGQTDPAVQFTVKGAGHTIYFTPEEIVLVASAEQRAYGEGQNPIENSQSEATDSVVHLRFLDANSHPVVEGLEPLPGVVNFFLGSDSAKWRVNVPTYEAVIYRDLYPGIDLVYRGTEGHLKSEFRLAPGADPAAIQMAYEGITDARVRENGALILETSSGELIEEAPLIYQGVDGVQQIVAGGYTLIPHSPSAGYIVGFQLAAHDPTLPLVIDPVLDFSTYLGGSGSEQGRGVAVDGDGNVYVTGYTQSGDFPTRNALDTSLGGTQDVFVTQIISTSEVYTYGFSTYLGGSGYDYGYAVAVDDVGNVYLAGSTWSGDFPTQNALDTSLGGSSDLFVTQIVSASGVYTFGYSTYLGGSGSESGYDIALDGAGNVYMTGETWSSDFPTHNELDTSLGGTIDAFVTQIISAGGVYTYGFSSYLGGSGNDRGLGIAVDRAGNVSVVGETSSSDFSTYNAFDTSLGGSWDAFVTQIVSTSGVYTYGYSSYLGGGSSDYGNDIAVDSSGNAYVTGDTSSGDFPTHNALDTSYGGVSDAFVTQIVSASGVYIYGYSSYLGGGNGDYGYGIFVDSAKNIYVTGYTLSGDFPTHNAPDTSLGGGRDAFVTQLINIYDAYIYGYSTYLGGSGYDYGNDIAVDGNGNAYVTGIHYQATFPPITHPIRVWEAARTPSLPNLARCDQALLGSAQHAIATRSLPRPPSPSSMMNTSTRQP
jgi:hypothetical protein